MAGSIQFLFVPHVVRNTRWIPKGFDKSKLHIYNPVRVRPQKMEFTLGCQPIDDESYQIAMQPAVNQDKVIPDSFRILLCKYLGKPETKSLAPDRTPCTGATRGLLQRARIPAGKLVPVGKETDRRWDRGDDPSMIDSDIYAYESREKLEVADKGIGVRPFVLGLSRSFDKPADRILD
jgi:hypothetical protein